MRSFLNKYFLYIFIYICFMFNAYVQSSEFKIVIDGNERISSETIKMFSQVNNYNQINASQINQIIKDLYNTNFFRDISIEFKENVLFIKVIENPIIQNISYKGIKSNNLQKQIADNLLLKSRSSYSEFLLEEDKKQILENLRKLGYYFSTVDISVIDLKDNRVDILYDIDIKEKAKIKKITFLGDKIYKDNKLKNIIVSEEYKFWKVISGKKYLNEDIIKLDERLLKQFYLNNGYFNVNINSTFAKANNINEFELIYNIDADKKFFFGELSIQLPNNYDVVHFNSLNKLFNDLKDQVYSISKIEKILDEIDNITLNEEYDSIKASVKEEVINNKINLSFLIEETEKFYVNKINILGNNITRENVIRNQLEIDEGDPFNEILFNKSINNIRSLNFFKTVDHNINSKDNNDKEINIIVDEKATGEIMAGAGFGTSGATFIFGVKENNYLGKGISLNSNLEINENSIKGVLSIANPNLNNSDNSGYFTVETSETDKLSLYGYKNNKTGFAFGTAFEYLDDLRINLGNSNYFEKIETDSTASALRQRQKGNYFDSFIKLDLDYDKRNQRYQTSSGYISKYSLNLPIISETNTISNSYNVDIYKELYSNNITSFSFGLHNSNSLSGDNIKLSERLYIPSRKLRGFEAGKVGPKDGEDFIGGNYYSSFNISSTLPQILPNNETTDIVIFFDAANLWGVDYNSTLDNNKIRSSIGIGVDWWTPIGPLSFSLSEALTKSSSDITESFRFNIGTTF